MLSPTRQTTPWLMLNLAALVHCGTAVADTDKTLVSWVSLANTTQQGGSALTIQRGDQFDAIVFGETAAGKWMAGSNNFSRTQREQQANAVETAGPDMLVQIAIVYEGEQIRFYRNGEAYAAYTTQNVDLVNVENHIAVFGLRHVGGRGREAPLPARSKMHASSGEH